jgi:hypothetical protein
MALRLPYCQWHRSKTAFATSQIIELRDLYGSYAQYYDAETRVLVEASSQFEIQSFGYQF